MTRGITGKEPDPSVVYADILNHPHWQSPTRPHMSLYDRAAQFAPFAALTGYDDMVNEEARTVDSRILQGDEETALLNRKLTRISDAIREGSPPAVSITYFVPDPLKAGGKYETISDTVRMVDVVRGKLVLMQTEGYGRQNKEIALSDILEIQGDLLDDIEDGMG